MTMHPSSLQQHKAGRSRPVVSLLTGFMAVALHLAGVAAALQWTRTAPLAPHRLVGCHLVHFTEAHLVWDVLGLVVPAALCEMMDRRRLVLTLVLSAALIPMVVWLGQPGITTYRGLSGLCSAVGALLAVMVIRRLVPRRGVALLVLLAVGGAFAGKLIYEWHTGAALFVTDLGPGVVPVPLAHLAGAAVGLAVAIVPTRWSRWRRLGAFIWPRDLRASGRSGPLVLPSRPCRTGSASAARPG